MGKRVYIIGFIKSSYRLLYYNKPWCLIKRKEEFKALIAEPPLLKLHVAVTVKDIM